MVLAFVLSALTPGASAESVAPVQSALGGSSVPVAFRVRVERAGRATYGSAILLRRVPGPGASALYFLTAGDLFKDAGAQRPAYDDKLVVEIGGSTVTVLPQDVSVPAGSHTNVAILKATTTIEVPEPRPLTMTVPPAGALITISGFDRRGMKLDVGARISRIASLLIVANPASPITECAGSAATAGPGTFGIVTDCSAAGLTMIMPLAAIAPWIERIVPVRPSAPRPVETAFELTQRDIVGPMLSVACGEAKTGEVDLPFTLKAGETPIDASATFVNRASLKVAEVSVLRLAERSVRLRFTLTGQPAIALPPSAPCPAGRALLSVRVEIISHRRP
jgi:hypothetical protein